MKFFDLFCGIGGFRLGLEQSGHECIGACEIDRYARQVYEKRFDKVPMWSDATKINPGELPDFDMLSAGFPCQAFSLAGRRLGFEDSRGQIFYEIARIAREKRPKLLFLENVKGLLFHDGQKTITVILNTLEELGYDIEWQVINSKYFVPQNRERIFFIGHLRGTGSRQVFPLGEDFERNLRTQRKTHEIGKITGLYALSHTKVNMKQRYQKRDHTWSLDTSGNKMGIEVKIGAIRTRGEKGTDDRGYRLENPKDYSNALTNVPKDNVVVNKPTTMVRRLTPLECERLQGFPDRWTAILSDTQRYKCLGNAVTVDVVKYIGSSLILDEDHTYFMEDDKTPKIVLRKSKSGKGYTITKKESFIPTEHFQTLLKDKTMVGFPSKDRETGEIRKTDAGKTIFVNYVENANYDKFEEYCTQNNIILEVN